MVRPILLLALLLPAAGRAQERPPPSPGELSREAPAAPAVLLATASGERPPLTGDRVFGQVTTGVLGGVVGAAAVGFGYYYAIERGTDEWAGLGAAMLGFFVGYPAGAATGVYLVSNHEDQTGSLLATVAGAAAGALVGALLATPTGGLSYLVLAPVGAASGFNLTRRYRDPPGSLAP